MFDTKSKNELLKKIAQKYSIELFLLFGSRFSGTAYKGSDFDIAYLGKKTLDLEEESQLIIDLSLIFKSENIDLVNLRKASPLLFYAITKECQVLYETKPLIFHTLRAYGFKKYVETMPLYEEKMKRIQKEIKNLSI